jgi:hypothetical protein
MRIVILQPGYLPWLGFFDQLRRCDCFVIYDDVQYTHRDWRSRNRIKTRSGAQWLTVPVLSRGRRYQLINETEIDYDQPWVRKHTGAIEVNYAEAEFFSCYFAELKEALCSRPRYLLELDMTIIRLCAAWLGIKTPMLYASQISVTGKSSERLLHICQHLGADHYLTGDSARDYLDEDSFRQAGITMEYHNYQHPVYKQLYGAFIPYMSIIDLFFNHGPASLAILAGSKLLESEV